MPSRVTTLAFEGFEARKVEVEVALTSGQVAFVVVGLGDKAVTESRERVRGAFGGLGLSLPGKRIVVNLSPADLPKEGSHYDLPIALGLLVEMGLLPQDFIDPYVCLGELRLNGELAAISGALPAAIAANSWQMGLICPKENGPEATWAGDIPLLTPASLISLINHVRGQNPIPPPEPAKITKAKTYGDLRDVKGQESAKRTLEIAAAGGHNLLFVGPPGSGKSMLAQRLPSILPALTPSELLETSQILSMAGLIERGCLIEGRPFRAPHHSASMAALTGGGMKARPGEVSLAHHGVLFLDELPEFSPQALDSLRQPLETGEVMVARANHHFKYPARVQLVAAMNPCRCGHGGVGKGACGKAPKCLRDYQGRVSGPLMDRIDLQIDVPAVSPNDLALPPAAEGSLEVGLRVANARKVQTDRANAMGIAPNQALNALSSGEALETICQLDEKGRTLLLQASQKQGLSARGFTRTLRLARTIADLSLSERVERLHLAEALGYRRRSIFDDNSA